MKSPPALRAWLADTIRRRERWRGFPWRRREWFAVAEMIEVAEARKGRARRDGK